MDSYKPLRRMQVEDDLCRLSKHVNHSYYIAVMYGEAVHPEIEETRDFSAHCSRDDENVLTTGC